MDIIAIGFPLAALQQAIDDGLEGGALHVTPILVEHRAAAFAVHGAEIGRSVLNSDSVSAAAFQADRVGIDFQIRVVSHRRLDVPATA
jgi:hypothetical protein